MDPSIMKLLEDDEDESMHSGADVEAFTAALNQDIGRGGDADEHTLLPESSDGNTMLDNGSTLNQLPGQWQTSAQEDNHIQSVPKLDQQHHLLFQEHHPQQMEQIKQQPDIEKIPQQSSSQQGQSQIILQKEQGCNEQQQKPQPQSLQAPPQQLQQQTEQDHANKNILQLSDQTHSQNQEEIRVQNSENQQQHPAQQSIQHAQASDPANPMRRMRLSSIPFHALIPVLRPHLDKDRSMQLNNVFSKLKSNEISREDFLRVIRNIVGDQMLRQAAHKVMQQQAQALAARNSQVNQNQHQVQMQSSLQQFQTRSTPQFSEHQSFTQVHPASSSHLHNNKKSPPRQSQVQPSIAQMQHEATSLGPEGTGRNSKISISSDGQGLRSSHISSTNTGTNKKEEGNPVSSLQSVNTLQNHTQLPSASFSIQGGTMGAYNMHVFPRPALGTPANSLKPVTQDLQKQIPLPHGTLSSQTGTNLPVSLVNVSNCELQNAVSDTKKPQLGSLSQYKSPQTLQSNQATWKQAASNEHRGISSSSDVYVKQEVVDPQNKTELSINQSSLGPVDADQVNCVSDSSKDERSEKQQSKISLYTSPHAIGAAQMRPQAVPTASATPAATNAKTPQKKPSSGQKKPLDSQSTPPATSKKQKVSGAFQDQSIEQLNDVTAVSGVNLREEEEQLLAAPKEESRASEATRRAVQEEEERLFLQKLPLQKKIAEIMSKCGIENASSDVERCLSMCVEDRLRGLICNLIRLSKQRVDVEKARHRIAITSDVRREVSAINRKAKEEWEKKRAEEAEKLRKSNNSDGSMGADAEKDEDEGRSKIPKPNKEEDDKMRTTATNVAVRAATGGDDLFLKWKLMIEQQARPKCDGGSDVASGSQQSKTVVQKALPNLEQGSKDNQGDKFFVTGASAGVKKLGRSPALAPPIKVARNISVKDVIAVLEREPQMSKSALIYRLYERTSGDAVVE